MTLVLSAPETHPTDLHEVVDSLVHIGRTWAERLPDLVDTSLRRRIEGAAFSAMVIIDGDGGPGPVQLSPKTSPDVDLGGLDLHEVLYDPTLLDDPNQRLLVTRVQRATQAHARRTGRPEQVIGEFLTALCCVIAAHYQLRLLDTDFDTGQVLGAGDDLAPGLPAAFAAAWHHRPPMQVLAARHERAGTRSARLAVLVDRVPELPELRFTAYPVPAYAPRDLPSTLYVAVDGGYVFFLLDDPTPGRAGEGCNGATFDLVMVDGTRRRVVGPWSSSADVVAEVAPAVDVYPGEVTFHVAATTYRWGGGGVAGGTLTTAAAQQALRLAAPAGHGWLDSDELRESGTRRLLAHLTTVGAHRG